MGGNLQRFTQAWVVTGIETATGFAAFVAAVNFACGCVLNSHLEPSSRVRAFQD